MSTENGQRITGNGQWSATSFRPLISAPGIFLIGPTDMKFLLVSDLHYTLKQFDWLHGVAEQFDLVVIAGDHLDISAIASVDAQVVVVLKYLRRLKERTRLVVSSGNHDLTGRGTSGERVARWMAKVREIGVPADGDAIEL